ncbi:aldehyde dehydrogenase family protein, partial [Rhizobium ruizarguesonis]
ERWCQALITEDNALAEAFATDRRVSFLSFIGSAKVGWYLKSKLPPGTRCALEHGGAAPVIVETGLPEQLDDLDAGNRGCRCRL